MKFAFTDEQRMLQDTCQSFLADTSDSAAVRRAMASDAHFDSALWRNLCESMYWQGILVPESCDGLGLGWVEMAIVLEAAGERLLTGPLFAVTQSAAVLNVCPESQTRNRVLTAIAAGDVVAAALSDPSSGWTSCDVTAQADGPVTRLSGKAGFVPFGFAASQFIVASTDNAGKTALWVVDAQQAGVSVTHTPTMDQTRSMAGLTLTDVAVTAEQLLATDSDVLLANALALSRILIVADQVGVSQASLDISVAYTQDRYQFDRSISSFQAIKHKAADMMLKAESARSLLYYAACVVDAWMAGNAVDEDLQEAACMASACASEAAFFNAGTGIQLHGGVGITEEYDIQLYFKRARATESYFGRPAEMREALAVQLLDGDKA